MSSSQAQIGRVQRCRRYPVKSFQGIELESIEIGPRGVVGDRAWGIVDDEGHVLSAKRFKALFDGTATDETITVPGHAPRELGDPEVDAELNEWLGRPVRLVRPTDVDSTSYEMTFDPPEDDSDYFEIPSPEGSFRDLADVHLLTTATLDGFGAARPDLDWDVRRFRPNLVLDVDGAEPLVEQTWLGREIHVGPVLLRVDSPTVRCAMPLRAQPGGLERQPGLFQAMNELNETFPNHLGVYCTVVIPGTVSVGDPVSV
ncbi:MAG: MOSC domain-containing protein [Acidimicrobiales bacterium]|nr:MOSC domain-containing protein [Acidimicrobiales bacterium]